MTPYNLLTEGLLSTRKEARAIRHNLCGRYTAEILMARLDAVKIVESFWADVWVARNPEAVDRYVIEDFTLTTGGVDIHMSDSFRR